jgi:hypothetical protein
VAEVDGNGPGGCRQAGYLASGAEAVEVFPIGFVGSHGVGRFGGGGEGVERFQGLLS